MSQASQLNIAELNDRFRQGVSPLGKVLMTPAVSIMSIKQRAALMEMIRNFNDFNEGNDPHDEHDYGSIEFEDEDYLWKIDYYDVNYEYGAEDPSNSFTTRRVMTVMHSSEY
jgi:Protein of unknown function (DUF3768)